MTDVYFMRKFLLLSTLLLCCSLNSRAQCNPTGPQSDCERSLLAFEANSPGYTSQVMWDFGDGTTSTQINPSKTYDQAGTYTVVFEGSGSAGSCTTSLTVQIRPTPEIKVSLISDESQCFKNNLFCLIDSTITVGKVTDQTYLISNGLRIDSINPKFPHTLCMPLKDPQGGKYSLDITSKDSNGCRATKTFPAIFTVYPLFNASFTNISPGPNPGCGTTLGRFKNTSTISLAEVESFTWHYGDGTSTMGTTDSGNLWATGSHTYTAAGSFDVKLTILAKSGCQDSFTLEDAVGNTIINPSISAGGEEFSIQDMPIEFHVDGLPSGTPSVFIWNFGNPALGSENTNLQTLNPKKTFNLGSHLISLRLYVSGCSFILLDTIQVLGPLAQIETATNKIPLSQKFQCSGNDSVYFTNYSSFYQNDSKPYDEDSLVTNNGKSQFAFNYTPPFPGSNGSGDQTPLASLAHIANRTMGPQVQRVWDFGDKYAPQCTTSLAKGINLGINCNYSEDEFPVHKYLSWDSIYHTEYFLTNDSFTWTKYNELSKSCYIEYVDTTNPNKHYEIFSKTIPSDYTATLTLRDTIKNVESKDVVTLKMHATLGDRLTVSKKNWCQADCTWAADSLDNVCHALPDERSNYVKFDLGETAGYFAINFDSAANPNNFEPWDKMNALAGSVTAERLRINQYFINNGKLPTKIMRGYTAEEINKSADKTIGLIVGSGPFQSNGLPSCLDTFWYPNLIHLSTADASFELITEDSSSHFCNVKDVSFKIDNAFQKNIATLSWDWGYSEYTEGPDFDKYIEEFHYLEDYEGPSPSRNDKNLIYAGEKWLYNYVVRISINATTGITLHDTVVTAIVKDWQTTSTLDHNDLFLFNLYKSLGYTEIPENEFYKLLIQGNLGCIDTTGLSEYIEIIRKEYRDTKDVFTIGDRRYRYINATETDSIEVAHILHFRDSSLQGYDTLIVGNDTTLGVWEKEYTYLEITNGDTITRNASGPMAPTLTIQNREGCTSTASNRFNIGFFREYSMSEATLCKELNTRLDYNILYYQNGVTDPETYPYFAVNYWEMYSTFSNERETITVDWDSTDGVWDNDRSYVPNHTYRKKGDYTVTVIAKDSTGCRDTAYLSVSVSSAEASFGYELDSRTCVKKVNFTDSSTSTSGDTIVAWEWDFGDGTRNSILQNPTHNYTQNGYFNVRLTIRSVLGCYESIEKMIYISGPQPEFEFDSWEILDTAVICAGDSIFLANTSRGDYNQPSYIQDWGDGSVSVAPGIGERYGHQYNRAGTYDLFLNVTDFILGADSRCSRVYPDTNPELLVQNRLVVVVNERPSVRIGGRTVPTYQDHPTEFIALLDPKYTRINWIIQDGSSTPISKVVPDTALIYKFQDVGVFNVILAPEYDKIPRCWDRDTFEIKVLNASLNSITEPAIGLDIFPNPAYDKVYVISKEGTLINDIQVTDILGKSYSLKHIKSGTKVTIDVSVLAAGTYTLRVVTNRGTIAKKIQVLRE